MNARESEYAREVSERLDETVQVTSEILQQMNDKSNETFERAKQHMVKQTKLLVKLPQVKLEPTNPYAEQLSKGPAQQQGVPREGKKVEWKEGLPHPMSVERPYSIANIARNWSRTRMRIAWSWKQMQAGDQVGRSTV